MAKPQIFLIDAHALCYRAFYAIPELSNSKGQATNAVYGFVNILRKLIKTHKPAYMAVCFDTKAKTKRAERYEQYKIQRPSMPEALSSQIPLIRNVIQAYGIPIFEKDGYEADDVIATLTDKLKCRNHEVVIVSDDKDMFQLVDEHVQMFSTRKEEFYGVKETEARFGFPARFITDWIALAGDTSDNIPGIRGIGPGTAQKLINAFGSLEEIFAHIDEVKGAKLKENLQANQAIARLSKELAQLEHDVDVPCDLETLMLTEPDRPTLLGIFQELEFQRWVDELAVTPTVASRPVDSELVDNAEAIEELRQQLSSGSYAAMIWHDNGPECPAVLWISVDQRVSQIPFLQWPALEPALTREGLCLTVFDVKSIQKKWATCHIRPWHEFFDVLLAGYVLSPSVVSFSLKALAWTYLKEDFGGEGDGAAEAALLERLAPLMRETLRDHGLEKVYEDIEAPLSQVLLAMEKEGVCVDTSRLADLSRQCTDQINGLKDQIFKLAGEAFNLNSPKQLAQVLFEKLKLPTAKKTKTGFSTNEEVLVKLADRHPLPAMILEYRQLAKLQSTYIDALPKLINPDTGRIHATFNQAGAETGRLSSTQPNLQNIPIRAELGRKIRQTFIPSNPKRLLLSADYSQIELRILAHLAEEKALIKAFAADDDIHRYTAGLIFDVPEADVDAKMRDAAKRVNFGIIYGISAFGLAKDLQVPMHAAQDFIDRYFLRYPGVKTFMDQQIALAEGKGYVETMMKRRRYIPEIHSRNNAVKQFAQRQAINTPVQGTAADLIKMAMIAIDREIASRKMKSRMIITVHDELVFDITPDERDEMIQLVRREMEGQMTLSVPIKASVKIGPNWLDMEKE